MPLMKKASKKAFEHNIKAEMHAGKPQDQSLAIAYSVKRKAKKKMAEGGVIKPQNTSRPDKGYGAIIQKAEGGMVDANDKGKNDRDELANNSGNKAPHQDQWTDRPDIAQSQRPERPGKLPIKHPKIMKGGTFTTKLRDQEDDLEMSAAPVSPKEQPPQEFDEEGPDRQGPQVDIQDEHSTHRKPYAKGGQIERSDEQRHMDGRYEDDLLDLPPSEDKGSMMADSHDEMGQDRQGPGMSDNEDPHSEHDEMYSDNMRAAKASKAYAAGGSVESGSPDMNMADGGMIDNEEELEHAASIAAAIMAKRRMARGGAILSEDSMSSDDSDQADLSRNAEEDANMEDKASFDALRKENYSESDGLSQLDSPDDSNEHSPEHDEEDVNDSDIVSAIRRKMKMRSAIVK